jgi:ribose/xylose/arabinose/galactoside ABC-type transport system permease subunit
VRSSEDPSFGLLLASISACLSTTLVAGLFVDYFKAEVFVWSLSLMAVLASLAPAMQQDVSDVTRPSMAASLEESIVRETHSPR